MDTLETLFWISLSLVFYTYVGYGVLLWLLVQLKSWFVKEDYNDDSIYEPMVTLFVAAYNEKNYIKKKMENMLELDYPAEKLQLLFVTDGSDDGTPELLKKYPQVEVFHENKRGGKIAAINRGMKEVKHPFVIYSDANAMLNPQAIREIIKHYKNPRVGCVAGEKRVLSTSVDGASGAGEGLYWRYESFLKLNDYKLYSAVGAAGELFSIRTRLHHEVEKDTILDDFIISLRIAQKGYIIAYEAKAFASEEASVSIADERKRKVRISAGGIQSIFRLGSLFNIFKYGVLSFQFISHRVLRWTVTPVALFLLIPLNVALLFGEYNSLYWVLFAAQLFFYSAALLGFYYENKAVKIKAFFVPYYFLFMNLCVISGFFRIMGGGQSVLWEKARI